MLLTINKQPAADTRNVSRQIAEELQLLKKTLPDDVRIDAEMYQQRAFIDLAVANVVGASPRRRPACGRRPAPIPAQSARPSSR